VLLMLASIAVNHLLGLRVSRQRKEGATDAARRRSLGAAVAFNLAILFAFKYAPWLLGELRAAFLALGVESAADWYVGPGHLPIGISFFTFQALSYVIDVYRGSAEAQRNPLSFALYIALFPQLIAGPIVRYADIASQLSKRTVGRSDVALGLRRFVIGLGKKVLIADLLAGPARLAFDAPASELTTSLAWIGLLAYTLQIYFDFSGYSDMAIGLSRVFGFRLLENFRWPLISASLTEFWRRWHISLSTWFRDYLYIPLGGNRRGSARTYLNLTLVFLLCGLWHGASWNFAVWGLYHGAFLIVERAGLSRWIARLPRPAQHVYLLLAVMGSWVLFRSTDFAHASRYYEALLGLSPQAIPVHTARLVISPPVALAFIAGVIGATPIFESLGQKLAHTRRPRLGVDILETAALATTFVLSLMMVAADGYSPFIYFRF